MTTHLETTYHGPATKRETVADWRLDRTLRHTLEATVARILPSNDGPGAAETGVAAYIERRLAADTQAWEALEQGLGTVQSWAEQRHGASFAECLPEQQDAVLRWMQSFPHPALQQLFQLLIDLSLEGFLSHPRRGGNLNALGWSYVGYEPSLDPALCGGGNLS